MYAIRKFKEAGYILRAEENKLTVHDIYTKLIKIQDIEVPLDVAMDDLINCD